MSTCSCKKHTHQCKLIVITGGPGAGKTAILELARRKFCEHVRVLPEAASIIFGGGFPREDFITSKKASQRAIYHVQHELEQLAVQSKCLAIALCDRGTLDGMAYWPGTRPSYYSEIGTSEAKELKKYTAVIHLRSPALTMGYNHSNPLRVEDSKEAHRIDERIEAAWKHHPHRHFIDAKDDFIDKAQAALSLISDHLPNCCKEK